MDTILHRAEDRGGGDYGWLKTRYSFSFADWYEPTRMGFGALRVINDDYIAPGQGFGRHSHKDFEIITVVTSGAVAHEDSMGNTGIVRSGEVQTMSAGTGVSHAEFNASKTEPLTLFQIWIEPKEKGGVPRYAQASFSEDARRGAWQTLVSNGSVPGTLPVQQDARVARALVRSGTELAYDVAHQGNGIYMLVISGNISVDGETLQPRDAIGLEGKSRILLKGSTDADILLIEVPMR